MGDGRIWTGTLTYRRKKGTKVRLHFLYLWPDDHVLAFLSALWAL